VSNVVLPHIVPNKYRSRGGQVAQQICNAVPLYGSARFVEKLKVPTLTVSHSDLSDLARRRQLDVDA